MIKFVEAEREGKPLRDFKPMDVLKCVWTGSKSCYVGSILLKGKDVAGAQAMCLFDSDGNHDGGMWDNSSWRFVKIGELSLD